MSATAEATTTAADVRAIAAAAKVASRELAPLAESRRNEALEAMARAVEAATAELLAANAEDVRAAENLPASTMARLKLDNAKRREMVEQIRAVAQLADPLGRSLDAIELDDADGGLHMQ